MTPKKPSWFELTENNDAYAGIQKVNKKLPIATLALAGAIILGGSLFATANNPPSAVADTPTASQSVAATQTSTVAPAAPAAPIVAAAPQRGDERDHEGRDDD